MQSARRISKQDFDLLTPLLPTMRPDRIEAARLALVEGASLPSIAEALGMKSRQAVDDAVRIVWKTHLLVQRRLDAEATLRSAVPEGWISVRLLAPVELVPSLQELIRSSSAGDTSKERRAALRLNRARINAITG